MQDNAPIHKSKETIKFFEQNNVILLNHPPLSPDLNPIENLWGIMANEMYKNGRQYDRISDLKASLIECWNNISDDVLKKLINSMKDRIFEVIRNNGSHTHY